MCLKRFYLYYSGIPTDLTVILLFVYDAWVYCSSRDWSLDSWKLLNESMNFFVSPFLLSWNRYLREPKEVCLMSWILNFIVLPGIEGRLMSKFGFIFSFNFVVYFSLINLFYNRALIYKFINLFD